MHTTFIAVGSDGGRSELDGVHFRLYTFTELVGLLDSAGFVFERAETEIAAGATIAKLFDDE